VTAADWYSTQGARQAREFEQGAPARGEGAELAAAVTALLVLYRVIQEPGFDEVNTIEFGVPLALAVLGVITLACAASMRAEETGTEFREMRPAA
jgi:hypothetical protein